MLEEKLVFQDTQCSELKKENDELKDTIKKVKKDVSQMIFELE